VSVLAQTGLSFDLSTAGSIEHREPIIFEIDVVEHPAEVLIALLDHGYNYNG
jgi:hypothetical protein